MKKETSFDTASSESLAGHLVVQAAAAEGAAAEAGVE